MNLQAGRLVFKLIVGLKFTSPLRSLVSNVILRSEATKNLGVGLGISHINPTTPIPFAFAQGDITSTFDTTPGEPVEPSGEFSVALRQAQGER